MPLDEHLHHTAQQVSGDGRAETALLSMDSIRPNRTLISTATCAACRFALGLYRGQKENVISTCMALIQNSTMPTVSVLWASSHSASRSRAAAAAAPADDDGLGLSLLAGAAGAGTEGGEA